MAINGTILVEVNLMIRGVNMRISRMVIKDVFDYHNYWLMEPRTGERTEWIIRITKVEHKIPQKIEGETFNSKTGEFVAAKVFLPSTEDDGIIACVIGDDVTIQELKELKNKFPEEVRLFFGF
jgi:hypothetical protein